MPLSPDIQLHYVNTTEKAMELKRWLGERREVLGLDIETSGLEMHTPESRVRTVQVGDHMSGWVIPVEDWRGLAIEVLREYRGDMALHNGPFDRPWITKFLGYEIPSHQLHDTMVMAKINYPGQDARLKSCAVKYIDPNADSGQKELDRAFKTYGWDWNTVPTDFREYWIYAAMDPIITAHLKTEFRTDTLYPDVYALEMEMLRIAIEMERNGSRIDVDYATEKRRELLEYAESNKQWAIDNWGVNFNAPQQVVKYFQSLGAEFTRFTKKNAPSADKDMLEIFENDPNDHIAQSARFIMDTKRALKFATAYFGNFVDMSVDGLLHPSINTLEARTSRMSISNPALQQIPSKDSYVRNAFIPRNDGEQIVSVDYSQVELRILANLTKDPKLVADFHDVDSAGGDFFANMGRNIYKDPSFNKKDPRRKYVKSAMYLMNYGGGVDKLALTTGRPVAEMRDLLDLIFTTYPGIKKFQNDTINGIRMLEREHGSGWVETESGRKLPVDPGFAYKGVNYAIQSRAAEIMKRAIVRLDSAGLTPYMMLPIHDEVVSSVPREDVEDVIRTSEDVMKEVDHDVQIVAEGEGGFDRWGDKYA